MDESETMGSDGDAFVSLESDVPGAHDEIDQSKNGHLLKKARFSHDLTGAPVANNCLIPIESDGVASVSVVAKDSPFAKEDLDVRNAAEDRREHPDIAHCAAKKSTPSDLPVSPRAMAFAERIDGQDVTGNPARAHLPDLKPEYAGAPFGEVCCLEKSKSHGARAKEGAPSEVDALPLTPGPLYIPEPKNLSTNPARTQPAIAVIGNWILVMYTDRPCDVPEFRSPPCIIVPA